MKPDEVPESVVLVVGDSTHQVFESDQDRAIAAAVITAWEAHRDEQRCVWSTTDGDKWMTECGSSWLFYNSTPDDNGMEHCAACGKPVQVEDET